MVIEGQLNDISKGEFTLGAYTCEGQDESGEFKAIIIGVFFFEVWFKKY